MIQNLAKNKILWLLAASLSLIAASAGVLSPGVYSKVISTEMLPGTISQDLMTIVLAAIMLVLTVLVKEGSTRTQVVILGILGYLFYAYGIWVIERVYNMFYLLYMAIFTISFWSLVYALISIRQEALRKATMPNLVRNISVGFSVFTPLLFYPLWTGMLLPLMQTGRKIEFLYSVFILDMAFVMPAFIIVAFMAAKKQGWGLLLTPVLFVKGFTMLFSVGLGGILKPFYGQTAAAGEVGFYIGLSLLYLALAALHIRSLDLDADKAGVDARALGASTETV